MTQEELMRLMGLASSAVGAFGGVGGGGGLTMGVDAAPAPVDVAPVAPPIVNAGLPATPGAAPGFAPLVPVPGAPTVAPGPMSLGPSPVPPPPGGVAPPLPMAPGGPAGPVPDPVNPGAAGINPGPGWLQRNVSDPLGQIWNGTPKLDAMGNPVLGPDGKPILDTSSKLTDRQKALTGAAGAIGGALTKAGAIPAAAPGAGGGGAQIHRPAPLDASRLAASRLQQLQALQQRATLAAPWLDRYRRQQQGGLMG
jgi:hypothetical protein